jgi:leucyl aminopeptidase
MAYSFRQSRLTRRQAGGALTALVFAGIVAESKAQTPLVYHLEEKKRANARGRYDNQSSKSKRKDAGIEALIGRVDSARLVETLKTLTSFNTRWSMSPELVHVRDWIKQQFVEFGFDSSRVRLVGLKLANGTVAHSVICAPERLDQGFILIGAHYDAISENPSVAAPGADDDASGIAVVLETARIFARVGLKRGIMFAAFAGEEQGLFGSQAVANLAAKEKWAIDVMVNLDMVGHVDPERPTNIVVEYDMGNADPRNDAAAKAFGLQMAQLVADYTSMTVEHTDIWSSDYMPFESKGFPCIGLYDGAADAAFYHTTQDKIGQVDLTRLVDVTGLVCAFVANTAELKSS